jgi:O-antigen chain-terminating methyltransferase
MSQHALPKLSIDTVMQKIREEDIQIKEATIASEAFTQFDFSLLSQLEKLKKTETVIPNNNQYHINDFCRYHDGHFVENMFKGLLKRKPDTEEMNRYLLLLRQGQMSKKEMIAKIRFSTEGRSKSIVVSGIYLPFISSLLGRLPLIGFLFKIMMAMLRLPSLINQIRQLEAHSQIPEIKSEQLAELIQTTLQTSLQSVLAQKVERSELDSKAERAELESKAERSELANKVTQSELEEKVDYRSLASMLEAKVDQVALTEALALRVDYDSLKIKLAAKANQTDMTQALTQLTDHKVNLLDNQRRLNLLLEEARKRLPEPFSNEQLTTMVNQQDHVFDAMYMAFEDKFRGTRKDIKHRQEVYIPTIQQALKATKNALVIDMGCGRGEWLELLQEHDIVAQGIDLNTIMIKECESRQLMAKEADIIDYLRQLNAATVSAITGFHIIEHLPFKVMISFLDECLRVLKPGGVIIFETPNPENILVGACHFYTDPSHHNPLVPETMRFIVEQRGFEKTEIKRLHKYSDFYQVNTDDEFLKNHFYNEMDFAIIGHKV